MTAKASSAGTARVLERRRAVALARHYRDFEGLSIRQIADPSRPLSSDGQGVLLRPDERKARAVKARYVGVCCGCGAYTRPRNGKGDAYACCSACHPGAIARHWTAKRVLNAMREWLARYGWLPTSYDRSRTHRAAARGEPLERLSTDDWPSAGVVTAVYGSWKAAQAAAATADRPGWR